MSGRRKLAVGARLVLVLGVIAAIVVVQLTALHAHKHPRKHKHPVHLRPVAPRTLNGIPQPLGIAGDWKYVLDDEFNARTLDTSIWQAGWYGTGVTGAPNVLEDDCYSSADVTFPGDGSMHLAVTAQPSTCHGRTYPYTGALVSTNPRDGRKHGGFQYTYGVLEARIYVPGLHGKVADWPAFWSDGYRWPNDGEDDVMEGIGGSICFHFHSLHFAPHGPGGCTSEFRPGWHTFASDWEPGKVSYYYDGHLVGTVTQGITGKPMFIVIDDTVWRRHKSLTRPATLRVGYIRVWQPVAGSVASGIPYEVSHGVQG